MKSDLLDALRCACDGGLAMCDFRWHDQTSVAVVLAAPGYPEAPEYGSTIVLNDAAHLAHVFHAGTDFDRHGTLHVAGGRVLTVCSVADDLASAHARVYSAIDRIDWAEGYCRRDIGWYAQ
jgi:phosphoribosylamine--glycine ligase